MNSESTTKSETDGSLQSLVVPTNSGAERPRSPPVGELNIHDSNLTDESRHFLFEQGPDQAIKPVEVPRIKAPEYRFELLQNWEGVVTKVTETEFSADLRDLTDLDQPAEIVTFLREEISEGDEGLLEVGAAFYWSIGYEVGATGQKKRVSLLRFRRLANWTRGEVAVIDREASDFEHVFGLAPAS